MKHFTRFAFISLSFIVFNSSCFANNDECKNIDKTNTDYNTLIPIWPNKTVDNDNLNKCLQSNNPSSPSCTLPNNISKFLNLGCKRTPIELVTKLASAKNKVQYTRSYKEYKKSLNELANETTKEKNKCKNISLSKKDTVKTLHESLNRIKIDLNQKQDQIKKINNKLENENNETKKLKGEINEFSDKDKKLSHSLTVKGIKNEWEKLLKDSKLNPTLSFDKAETDINKLISEKKKSNTKCYEKNALELSKPPVNLCQVLNKIIKDSGYHNMKDYWAALSKSRARRWGNMKWATDKSKVNAQNNELKNRIKELGCELNFNL